MRLTMADADELRRRSSSMVNAAGGGVASMAAIRALAEQRIDIHEINSSIAGVIYAIKEKDEKRARYYIERMMKNGLPADDMLRKVS